jgi:hypothetical protein
MNRPPPHGQAPGTPDQTDPLHGIGRRIAISVPGAVALAALFGVLVFGIGIRAIDTLGGLGSRSTEITQVSTTRDGAQAEASAKPATGTIKGSGKREGSKANEAKPTAKPAGSGTEPVVKASAPRLALDGHKVGISWSVCHAEGFVYYRVVRSTDEAVSWPMGPGDVLIATIKSATQTRVADTHTSAGRRYFYRVVGIAKHDGPYRVACRSAVQSIVSPKAATPSPAPSSGALSLALSTSNGHPYVDWSACGRANADWYKVVRSPDATVRWPLGGNDTLVAAVGIHDKTALWDSSAPHGKKVWYRVFCVDGTDSGYRVLRASSAKAIVVPTEDQAPMPSEMSFDVEVVGGEVALEWEACGADGFSYYKVVRSPNPNPSYLPWTDGSEVIAVISDAGTTTFTDTDVASGQTWYYRVQSIGYWQGQKIVLGQTDVESVTIP